jgi:hypothetical protein
VSRVVVVYESIFGNTRSIAEAVAAGLRELLPVELHEVAQAPTTLDDVLLVVGAPTHAFSLSRPQTRQTARASVEGEPVSAGIGLREWLDVARLGPGVRAVAFDTRVNKSFVPGSAAKAAHKRLRHLGVASVGSPESFWVADTSGPLLPGELERATAWGRDLATGVAH